MIDKQIGRPFHNAILNAQIIPKFHASVCVSHRSTLAQLACTALPTVMDASKPIYTQTLAHSESGFDRHPEVFYGA